MIREIDGGDCLGWYAKGHHDPEVFVSAVDDEWGNRDGWPPNPLPYVRHLRWRNVPTNGEACTYMFVEGTGPGSYPVTALELEQYHADRSIGRILAKNEATMEQHAERCPQCASGELCWWGGRITETIVSQRARAETAKARLDAAMLAAREEAGDVG